MGFFQRDSRTKISCFIGPHSILCNYIMYFVNAVSIYPLLRIHFTSSFIFHCCSFVDLLSFFFLHPFFSFTSFSSTPLSSKSLISLPSHYLSLSPFLFTYFSISSILIYYSPTPDQPTKLFPLLPWAVLYSVVSDGILEQSLRDKNRVETELSYLREPI